MNKIEKVLAVLIGLIVAIITYLALQGLWTITGKGIIK